MTKGKNACAKYLGKYLGKPLTDDPDDAPELLEDFLRHGELRHGDRLIRRGRPPIMLMVAHFSSRSMSRRMVCQWLSRRD
jgi:hypothetical protein